MKIVFEFYSNNFILLIKGNWTLTNEPIPVNILHYITKDRHRKCLQKSYKRN